MTLRDKITNELLSKFPIEPKQQPDPKYSFYYADYKDNLFGGELGKAALAAYGNGSGGETKESVRIDKNGIIRKYPPKMASIVSSSAMTFNLLGNERITIPNDYTIPADDKSACTVIPSGEYDIVYEKQLYTLKTGSSPANLDAFIYCEKTKTAIFCEMKNLEWLGKPGILKAAYLDKNNFFNPNNKNVGCGVDAFAVFENLIKKIAKPGEEGHEFLLSRFYVYDAWQMLKHTLAIYNYTSLVTRESVNTFNNGKIKSLANTFTNIVLLNVVNEIPDEWITDEETKAEYSVRLADERNQAHQFISVMMNHANGLRRLFDNNCNAGLCIAYITAKEFSEMIAMSKERKEYLKRYFN